MAHIDLNCDMGEGIGNDAAIMPYISSANIACGAHAGDEQTIADTIKLAMQYNVAIGAHPGFADKANFGRIEIVLSHQEVYALVLKQVMLVKTIAEKHGAALHHIKPHGALYNMAARDKGLAGTIAAAVKKAGDWLILYGLANSYLISEAKAIGLATASEVFADRRYNNDGSLVSRTQPNALIENEEEALAQVINMALNKTVLSIDWKAIPVIAETVCLHGDGKHAVEFAGKINEALSSRNITIKCS